MRHAEQDVLAGGFFKRFGPKDKQLVSCNLDEASSLLQRDVGPQKYELQGRTKPFFANIQFKKLNDLTLSYAWFAPAMIITSTPSKPNYTLFFRLHGSSEYSVRQRLFVTSPSCGAFLPGMQPLQVRTKENWHVFGTRFSPAAIQLELSRLLGRETIRPLEFDPEVNFEFGAGRAVKRVLARLYQQAGQDESEFVISTLGMRQLERSLITLVLEGLKHNYSKFVNGPERNVAPWQVRAVEEFILENAEKTLSLGDLAVIGGVSGRSLQYSFRRYTGCSPMEFLRRTRLERVQKELLHPIHDTTVTSTAMRWGFLHLGRFAGEYGARFGESPSATLRRSA
jgi:AraC-like DNA-binding protein